MTIKSVLKKILFTLIVLMDLNALSAETMTPVNDEFKIGIASSIDSN